MSSNRRDLAAPPRNAAGGEAKEPSSQHVASTWRTKKDFSYTSDFFLCLTTSQFPFRKKRRNGLPHPWWLQKGSKIYSDGWNGLSSRVLQRIKNTENERTAGTQPFDSTRNPNNNLGNVLIEGLAWKASSWGALLCSGWQHQEPRGRSVDRSNSRSFLLETA